MEKKSAFTWTLRQDNVGVITFDVPGEKMNTLKAEFAGQIREVLADVQRPPQLMGLVIISGKSDAFIAGADITMIATCSSAQQAEELVRHGQDVMAEIASFPVPIVAAIHGACLGGGLELALACHQRVCTLDDTTCMSLPEVRLGLLPGAGGTQRLPRLIGPSAALDMIMTGKTLRAGEALKAGLVDDAVPHSILLETAVKMIVQHGKKEHVFPVRERLFSNPVGRALLFWLAEKKAQVKTRGNYPATLKILQVVRKGLQQGSDAGYILEAQAFGQLAMTPESVALRTIFFAATEMKKEPGAEAQSHEIKSVGVLGGGLMGGGGQSRILCQPYPGALHQRGGALPA